MRAEPPGAGLPLTSSTAAPDAEVVQLAEVATGCRQAITPSLWTYTTPTTDGTTECGSSKGNMR